MRDEKLQEMSVPMTGTRKRVIPELQAWAWVLTPIALAACSKPPPQAEVLAVIEGDVLSLAADDTYVYATTLQLGKGSVVRVARHGGNVETIIPKIGVARSLAVDGSKLYFGEIVTQDPQGSGNTYVSAEEIKRSGGVVQAVVADSQFSGRIAVAPVSGGAATELGRFNGVPNQMMVDNTAIYVLSLGVWSSGANIDVTRGSLVKLPKTGGSITVLVDQLNKPQDLMLDATSAYWAANNIAWKIAKTGGKPERTSTSPATTHIDEPFAKTLVVGSTRYRALNKDSHATITIESSLQ